jgi:hypothetical protein
MIDDSSCAARRPRRAWPPAARTAAAVIAAAVALAAAACSGGPSSAGPGGAPDTGGPANSQQALAYSQCMRANGVPNYPDASGRDTLRSGLPKVDPRQLGVSDSRYQAAQRACAHLLPGAGREGPAASQRDLTAMRAFARCMRSHGVPTWPDPSYDSAAGWGFNLLQVHGFDPNSAQTETTMDECNRVLPPGIGVPLSRPGRPG